MLLNQTFPHTHVPSVCLKNSSMTFPDAYVNFVTNGILISLPRHRHCYLMNEEVGEHNKRERPSLYIFWHGFQNTRRIRCRVCTASPSQQRVGGGRTGFLMVPLTLGYWQCHIATCPEGLCNDSTWIMYCDPILVFQRYMYLFGYGNRNRISNRSSFSSSK